MIIECFCLIILVIIKKFLNFLKIRSLFRIWIHSFHHFPWPFLYITIGPFFAFGKLSHFLRAKYVHHHFISPFSKEFISVTE